MGERHDPDTFNPDAIYSTMQRKLRTKMLRVAIGILLLDLAFMYGIWEGKINPGVEAHFVTLIIAMIIPLYLSAEVAYTFTKNRGPQVVDDVNQH